MIRLALPQPLSRAAIPGRPAPLHQALLLALLLHVWLILMFGSAPGGSAKPGEGRWGSLSVNLRGLRPEAGSGAGAPSVPEAGPVGTHAQQRFGGMVRPADSPPPPDAGPGAARLGQWRAQPSERATGRDTPGPAPTRPPADERPATPAPAEPTEPPPTTTVPQPAPPSVQRFEATPPPRPERAAAGRIEAINAQAQARQDLPPSPSLTLPEPTATIQRLQAPPPPTASARQALSPIEPRRADPGATEAPLAPAPALVLPAAPATRQFNADPVPFLARPAPAAPIERRSPARPELAAPLSTTPALQLLTAPPAVLRQMDGEAPLPATAAQRPAAIERNPAVTQANATSSDLQPAPRLELPATAPTPSSAAPAPVPATATPPGTTAASATPERSTPPASTGHASPGPQPASPAGRVALDGSTLPGGPDAGARVGHDLALPPSAPASAPQRPLDLRLPRGGEPSRGSAIGLIRTVPVPPEHKNKVEKAVENAANKDCRDAYARYGVLAALPLAADALRDKGCRW
ncbi:hypothetical protein LZ017_11650 [Pelomonas sp. CA6]|uniref:hypothetical protein n=1 Tax=Pelomonas sp. CA6 TaxID=2907999 RepID=UPI001F4C1FDB|nr:hypothetical protein [Pelomonas sp. CA6]MCH7344033.1 hypothetical protein [Pelomonas sp. CA6]